MTLVDFLGQVTAGLQLGAAAIEPVAAIKQVDINEAGRVLATLNDVRVFVFALMFLLFLQTLERWWAGFRASKTADKFAVAADKLSDAVNAMAAAQAQLALEVRELGRGRQ